MALSDVLIFDTTLRDGEQDPGNSLSPEEKLRLARQLDALGVDVREAGFPAASEGDYRSVLQIATEIRRPTIAALARCHERDIELAGEALRTPPRRATPPARPPPRGRAPPSARPASTPTMSSSPRRTRAVPIPTSSAGSSRPPSRRGPPP